MHNYYIKFNDLTMVVTSSKDGREICDKYPEALYITDLLDFHNKTIKYNGEVLV